MSFDKFVVCDFETSGLNYYEKDFQVTSCSLVWNDGTDEFIVGQDSIGDRLAQLAADQVPIFVYNLAFELGVVNCVYPNIKLNFAVDVARLCQLYDGGGTGEWQGLSLKKCIKRILGVRDDYTAEIYEWLRTNIPGVRKGREGAVLSKAPYELLKAYNTADSQYTLKLYTFISKYFESEGYDWQLDHEYYFHTVQLVVSAKIRGIRVDREQLIKNLVVMQQEVVDLDLAFRTKYENELIEVRKALLAKKQAKLKKKILTELPPFNIGSKMQLKMLFVDLLKLDCGFTTPKGSPSFKSSHLPLYGEGGDLLAKRGKKLLIVNQAMALEQLSRRDGKWHPGLKVIGVRTGRLAGGN